MRRPGILTRDWWLNAPSEGGPRRRAVDDQPRLSEAATLLTSSYGSPDTERLLPTFASYAGDGYGGNSVVFSAVLARLSLFSEAEFKFQNLTDKHLFGDPGLGLLEEPWPGGTTGELLVRMEQDGSLAGNSFVRNVDGLQLERLRPDRVIIVSEMRADLMGRPYRVVVGYGYDRSGDGSTVEVYDVSEVAHWSPITDPLANFRGMSWLTPVVREINADQGMTDYKIKYLENAATPNLLVKYQIKLKRKTIEEILEGLAARHGGLDNAFKALIFDQGADATVVGNTFEQMSFTSVQAAGENRVLMAAGVPGIVVGSKEGLEAATYCLPGDSLVWTVGGPHPIRDVGPGDMVWSYIDGGLALRPVVWQARTGSLPIYTIRTQDRVLRASGNHPVLVRVPDGDRGSVGGDAGRHATVEWRTVDQVRPGDRVVQVRYLPDAVGGGHLPDGLAAAKAAAIAASASGLDDCLGFRTVQAVEIGPAEPVYDIQVEEGASFVADGIIVHNSNYGQAMRRFADITMRPNWRSACGALRKLVPVPAGSRLWWDPASIAALQQGEQERAATFQTDMQTAQLAIQAGYLPETVAGAVSAHDLSLLRHSGGIPTTLYQGGGLNDAAAAGVDQAGSGLNGGGNGRVPAGTTNGAGQ